jgi:hypothetical protein
MTATAAAPASAPIAQSAPRALAQPATDRFAFAAVLDSLPGAETNGGPSTAQDASSTSNERKQGGMSPSQPDIQQLLSGGAFLSSLAFAPLPAPASREGAAAADASLPQARSTIGSGFEGNAASSASDLNPANSAGAPALVGERAFHFTVSASSGVIAQRPPTAAPPATSDEGERSSLAPSSLAPPAKQAPGPAIEGATSVAEAASGSASASASVIGERGLPAGLSLAGGAPPDAADLNLANSAAGPTLVRQPAFLGASAPGGVIAQRSPTAASSAAFSEDERSPMAPSSLAPLARQSPGLASEGASSAAGAAGSSAPAGALAGSLLSDLNPANSAAAPTLVGERAFHLSVSASGGVIAERPPTAAPSAAFGEDERPSIPPLAMQGPGPASEGAFSAVDAAHASVSASASAIGRRGLLAGSLAGGALPEAASSLDEPSPAQVATRVGASSAAPSAAMPRATAQTSAQVGRKSDATASAQVARAANSPVASPKAEPSSNAAGGPPSDPSSSGAQFATLAGGFGAQPSTSLAARPSFGLDAASARPAEVAPRATLSAGATSAAPPVKEIDVDLSPGGLENVSMTMRLAGDKLSVVIRAASSQTSGSIEAARDAIVDRMAAIGQPLNSLIVQQVSVNADANTNGKASTNEGSTASERQSGESAGERPNPNDPHARRGASGGLRF